MSLDAATIATWGVAVISFLGALATGAFMLVRARAEDQRQLEIARDANDSADANKFRTDLQDFTKTLMAEINGLRDRIKRLEDDVIEKNKTVIKLQNRIAKISHVLMHEHNIDVDTLVKEAA